MFAVRDFHQNTRIIFRQFLIRITPAGQFFPLELLVEHLAVAHELPLRQLHVACVAAHGVASGLYALRACPLLSGARGVLFLYTSVGAARVGAHGDGLVDAEVMRGGIGCFGGDGDAAECRTTDADRTTKTSGLHKNRALAIRILFSWFPFFLICGLHTIPAA